MTALQSIDEGLFRFVNQKLANPVFDVLMPFLSGNKLFIPAVVVIVLLMLWRGGCKGRIYLLMIGMLLSIGDPFVCNPLKHHFQRPRPFVTLPDARLPGKNKPTPDASSSEMPSPKPRRALNSMPSAHAFNWGALAMITFIYYRRSWRFMVPLALAISFSRIYNGVHYPGDVLAGLLLGATYAFSGVITLNVIWGSLGKILFPGWHSRLPNLALPKVETTKATDCRANE